MCLDYFVKDLPGRSARLAPVPLASAAQSLLGNTGNVELRVEQLLHTPGTQRDRRRGPACQNGDAALHTADGGDRAESNRETKERTRRLQTE